jgi:hypothetical protein
MLDAKNKAVSPQIYQASFASAAATPALLNVHTDPRFLNEKRRIEVFL